MSVQIIRSKEAIPFNPSIPLEEQVRGSKQIVIDYNPQDSSVTSFIEQFERLAKSGISCQMNIKFNCNHTLESYRAERQLEAISEEHEMNDVIKKIAEFSSHADRELSALSQMCARGMVSER